MKTAHIRFYEELNDFLPPAKCKIRFAHEFLGRPSIKDLIESFGVPHTEIDLIIVNGISVDFNYLVNDKDDISVYPEFETMDITNVQMLRLKPLRSPKFVLDVHLGSLARYMRMCGFDTKYQNNFDDRAIIRISLEEKRTILTRDLGILKHSEVTHGYWIRSIKTEWQLREVIKRFDLKNEINEFSRCIDCNSILSAIDKEKVVDKIPAKVKNYQTEFYFCSVCQKIYWKGSHYEKMNKVVERIKNL